MVWRSFVNKFMPLIRAFIRGSLDAGQPLPRFASGVPCHAPTLPHRETVCAKTFTAFARLLELAGFEPAFAPCSWFHRVVNQRIASYSPLNYAVRDTYQPQLNYIIF